LRLSCFSTIACCGFALFGARAVRADIAELGMAMGRRLDRLEDLTSDAEALVVNGAQFRHSVTYTPEPVREVLDRFERECERDPGLLGQALRALPAGAEARLDPRLPRASRNAIVRDESEDGGMLVCFVGARPTSLDELKDRLEHFSSTLDLGEFGELIYTYVARKGDETRVITLWTDSGLNLGRMFPASGDAAGSDSSSVPRPPQARRTLTAQALGLPLSVRIYESSLDETSLDRFYSRELAQRGFAAAEGAKVDGTTAFVNRQGGEVFVSLASLDGKAFVTLVEAPAQLAAVSAVEVR
jgi:hypothetical protein